MHKAFLTLALSTVLAGCAATGEDYVKGVVPEVTDHPVLGPMNSKARVLLGPDANDNGVRDDIDRLASTRPAGIRDLVQRFAARFTEAMLAGAAGDKARAQRTAAELDATAAAVDAAADLDTSNVWAARIANTPERRAAASASGMDLVR